MTFLTTAGHSLLYQGGGHGLLGTQMALDLFGETVEIILGTVSLS